MLVSVSEKLVVFDPGGQGCGNRQTYSMHHVTRSLLAALCGYLQIGHSVSRLGIIRVPSAKIGWRSVPSRIASPRARLWKWDTGSQGQSNRRINYVISYSAFLSLYGHRLQDSQVPTQRFSKGRAKLPAGSRFPADARSGIGGLGGETCDLLPCPACAPTFPTHPHLMQLPILTATIANNAVRRSPSAGGCQVPMSTYYSLRQIGDRTP